MIHYQLNNISKTMIKMFLDKILEIAGYHEVRVNEGKCYKYSYWLKNLYI